MFPILAAGAALVGGIVGAALASSGLERSESARTPRPPVSPQSYVVTPMQSQRSMETQSVSAVESVRNLIV